MSTYNVIVEDSEYGKVIRLSFGAPSTNGPKVRDAVAALQAAEEAGRLRGGGAVFVTGPASLPVAMAIAHILAHRFDSVWVYDPKEDHYVCSIAHSAPTIGVERAEGPR